MRKHHIHTNSMNRSNAYLVEDSASDDLLKDEQRPAVVHRLVEDLARINLHRLLLKVRTSLVVLLQLHVLQVLKRLATARQQW